MTEVEPAQQPLDEPASQEALVPAPLEVDEPAIPEEPSDEVTLSNGVRLRLQSVSPILVRQASQAVGDRPKPPKYDNNGHKEDNPWHPEYIAAVRAWEADSAYAGVIVLVTRGVKEILAVPNGLPKIEDDAWLEDLQDDGIVVDTANERRRRRAWLHYVAFANNEDIVLVQAAVAALGGMRDAEVDAVVNSFRNRASRRANSSRSG